MNVDDKVVIRWTAPPDNGEQIVGYIVYIRQHDGAYTLDLADCDGSNPS